MLYQNFFFRDFYKINCYRLGFKKNGVDIWAVFTNHSKRRSRDRQRKAADPNTSKRIFNSLKNIPEIAELSTEFFSTKGKSSFLNLCWMFTRPLATDQTPAILVALRVQTHSCHSCMQCMETQWEVWVSIKIIFGLDYCFSYDNAIQ